LILNITVIVVSFCGGEYGEELILKFVPFFVRFWGWEYREELILNVTLLFCEGLGRAIYGGIDT
jgi:hypothetical protein